jgi:hypothetical protein
MKERVGGESLTDDESGSIFVVKKKKATGEGKHI